MESFEELSLREEVMVALGEVGLSKPTEIQCVDVTSGVLGSHSGSRKMVRLAPCLLFRCFLIFSMIRALHYLSKYIRREDSSLDALGIIISLDKVICSISSM